MPEAEELEEEIEAELIDPEEVVFRLASKSSRLIAFLLDTLLIGAFVLMVIGTFVIPQYYGAAAAELKEAIFEVAGDSSVTQSELLAKVSPQVLEMIHSCQAFSLFGFWLFYALSEIITGGSSLGKKVLSIRTISLRKMARPSYVESFVRAGLKTMALLAFFPFLLVSFLVIFISKYNQTGHDILTRTVVVSGLEEKDDEQAEDIDS